MNFAGGIFKQGGISSEKPAGQAEVSSSAVIEGVSRSGEDINTERWKQLGN